VNAPLASLEEIGAVEAILDEKIKNCIADMGLDA
jgi:hypothetical protein